jgi:hypothetical protein
MATGMDDPTRHRGTGMDMDRLHHPPVATTPEHERRMRLRCHSDRA